MKLSTFTIIKNEAKYVGYGIMSVLDYVDEMVFADGNSTDGTIEIIKYIQKKYDKLGKIKLYEGKDCKNLTTAYTKLFNWTLKKCTGDYVWFLHPDQICINPERIKKDVTGEFIRYSVEMISIAGDNAEKIIKRGRLNKWYTIYKNDFNLHYHGYYGSPHEDLYFGDITGEEHICHDLVEYKPYIIKDTGIVMLHYCDTKPYERRYDRMCKVLRICYPNQTNEWIDETAKNHPRVSIQDGSILGCRFEFIKNSIKKVEVFEKYDFSKFKK